MYACSPALCLCMDRGLLCMLASSLFVYGSGPPMHARQLSVCVWIGASSPRGRVGSKTCALCSAHVLAVFLWHACLHVRDHHHDHGLKTKLKHVLLMALFLLCSNETDGPIGFEQALKMVANSRVGNPHRLTSMFRRYDAARINRVSLQEFAQVRTHASSACDACVEQYMYCIYISRM